MIQKETLLESVDNSGIVRFKCIQIKGHGSFKKQTATVGDIISLSVKKTIPKIKKKRPFKKGDVLDGVVVATKQRKRFWDGSYLIFGYSAVLPFQKKRQGVFGGPKLGGTKIKAPLAYSSLYRRIHRETSAKIFKLSYKTMF